MRDTVWFAQLPFRKPLLVLGGRGSLRAAYVPGGTNLALTDPAAAGDVPMLPIARMPAPPGALIPGCRSSSILARAPLRRP